MTVVDTDFEVLPHPTRQRASAGDSGVPCAARPSTQFRHLDGPCRCFFGGPAPEYPPPRLAPELRAS